MPETGTARCHCGAVEIQATFPSRFALFVTAVDQSPQANSFPEERPGSAPFAELHGG